MTLLGVVYVQHRGKAHVACDLHVAYARRALRMDDLVESSSGSLRSGVVLAAPLRRLLFFQVLCGICAITFVIVALIRILDYRNLIDVVACGGLGLALGVILAANDTELVDAGQTLVVRNALLVHFIPWAEIVAFEDSAGLMVVTSRRRVTISAVPTGLASTTSKRRTLGRRSFARSLAATGKAKAISESMPGYRVKPNLRIVTYAFASATFFLMFGMSFWLTLSRT